MHTLLTFPVLENPTLEEQHRESCSHGAGICDSCREEINGRCDSLEALRAEMDDDFNDATRCEVAQPAKRDAKISTYQSLEAANHEAEMFARMFQAPSFVYQVHRHTWTICCGLKRPELGQLVTTFAVPA